MNVKVFNLMLRVSETRFLVQYELCKCKCTLNETVCNSKQKQNHNEYPCECKKLRYWISCKDDYMWNPSISDFHCKKTCEIDKCSNIKN